MKRQQEESVDMSAMLLFLVCLATTIGFISYFFMVEEPVQQLFSLELGPLLIALAMASLIGLLNSINLMFRGVR